MIWSTHLVGGLSTLWLLQSGVQLGVLPALSPEQIAIIAAASALGSLLPDLDASQSKIKHLSVSGIKPFYLPGEAIFHALGHRTYLHSLRGVLAMSAVAFALIPVLDLPLLDWRAALALVLGYASHLALDACYPSGIPLLYPNRRKFHLLPRPLRIATGSPPEEIVFILFALLTLLFFLAQLTKL